MNSTAREVPHAGGPVSAVVDDVPGSKSITNRALVCAALAGGESSLRRVPPGDDTIAMIGGLGALGIPIRYDSVARECRVAGVDGQLGAPARTVDAALAGTTSRFLTAVAALGPGPYTIDGAPPLLRRPMQPLHDALRALGADVHALDGAGHLPVAVGRGSLRGGTVRLPGDVSSQFVTALMLIAPTLPDGLVIELTTPLVSRPYVEITAAVMRWFGASSTVGNDRIEVSPSSYLAADVDIEPDASSASYAFAAAAVCGGSVTVTGLGDDALQGDARFTGLLGAMGCTVRYEGRATTVVSSGTLRGVDVDMADISDTVPTLAAVAPFASTPTRIRGVGFIRAKESDRIGDVVRELRRCGVDAEEHDDGMTIHPGAPVAAEVHTHHDHRIAMAFAVLGLRTPGLTVQDPGVVSKSWPGFWSVFDRLAASG